MCFRLSYTFWKVLLLLLVLAKEYKQKKDFPHIWGVHWQAISTYFCSKTNTVNLEYYGAFKYWTVAWWIFYFPWSYQLTSKSHNCFCCLGPPPKKHKSGFTSETFGYTVPSLHFCYYSATHGPFCLLMHLPFQSTETFYMCLFILYPAPYHLAAPTKRFATHNEWAASPPCCGYPRSGHTLYSKLFEANQILYSSLFAGMKGSGHNPLFIRMGCSHVRAEVGWPKSQGVCVRKCVWKKGQLNIDMSLF